MRSHAFTTGIVMASTTGTVHTLDDFIFSQGAAVKLTGILATSIGVKHCSSNFRICDKSVFYRMLAKRCLHRGFHCQPQYS